jgi:hypothetical protein
MSRITGGCQCGAVRYAVSGPLDRPSICHCRMCQKAFGSFFAPLVGVQLENFELTRGSLAIFKSSDMVERVFCRDCGTPLGMRDVDGDKIDVSIGSLDDPSAARPILQFGTEARVPWFAELATLPGGTTEENTAAEQLSLIASTNHQHPDHDTREWPPALSGRSRGGAG